MKIFTYWFWEAPEKVNEPVVVIDAFAASTNLVLMLSKKPERIILVNENNYLKALKIYPNPILIGESNKLPVSIFKSANPPSDIIKEDLQEKSIIYMSDNGTRVFEKFKKQKKIISCAFVNLKVVAKYLEKFSEATIIMAGDQVLGRKVQEDSVCADLIIKEINQENYDWPAVKRKLTAFIRNYYQWPPDKENTSLPLVFDLSRYEIIPAAFINKEGFVEIKDILT